MSVLVNKIPNLFAKALLELKALSTLSKAIAYGTKMVGGVTPGKGGSTHLNLPVLILF